MQSASISTKWTLLVMMIAFLAIAIGIVAVVNAHDGNPDEIHSCVNANSGEIKIIDADEECKKNETALDWSAEGAQGERIL